MADDLGFVHHYRPPADEGVRETILALHGTGGDENDLLPLVSHLAPGAGVLSPRGKILENGMPRWFRRLAEGVFDEEDLKARTVELADFVARAADHHGFDADRVIAVGFSNGANIAGSTLLMRPGVLAGAMLLKAMVPFEPADPPDLGGVPVFVSAGRRDPLIPPEGAEALVDLLRGAGADVTLNWSEGGHELAPPEVEAARAWLKEKGLIGGSG